MPRGREAVAKTTVRPTKATGHQQEGREVGGASLDDTTYITARVSRERLDRGRGRGEKGLDFQGRFLWGGKEGSELHVD